MATAPERRLMVCPTCSKRGVRLRMRDTVGLSHYACRYCDWFAWASDEQGQRSDEDFAALRAGKVDDREGRAALGRLNPDHPLAPKGTVESPKDWRVTKDLADHPMYEVVEE